MKSKIAFAVKILLGIVFLISAYTKFIAPGITEIILVDHGIVQTRELAALAVRILIGLEFGIGFLFLQPYYTKKISIVLASVFLFGFTAYLAYTGLILKDTQNCGCFGEVIKMSPLESSIKNIVLLGLLAVLYKFTDKDRRNIVVPSAIIVVSVTAVLLLLPVQNSKDFMFSGYTNFMGEGRVDLSNGDKIIAVFNLECDHCQEVAKEVTELKRLDSTYPPVYVLFFKEAENTPESFSKLTGSNFPYAMIGVKEFFDLIGSSPPRLYWLHNGKVKEYWDSDFVKHFKELKNKKRRT
jgi:hypothetical protein